LFMQRLNKATLNISIVFLIIVVIASIIQVITRKLGSSMVGTEEVARYAFVWMSLLGASNCINESQHAEVSILKDKLSSRNKVFHDIISNLIVLIFSLILLFKGIQLVGVVLNQFSPSLRIPMGLVYLAMPLAGLGMVLNSIQMILKNILVIQQDLEVE